MAFLTFYFSTSSFLFGLLVHDGLEFKKKKGKRKQNDFPLQIIYIKSPVSCHSTRHLTLLWWSSCFIMIDYIPCQTESSVKGRIHVFVCCYIFMCRTVSGTQQLLGSYWSKELTFKTIFFLCVGIMINFFSYKWVGYYNLCVLREW